MIEQNEWIFYKDLDWEDKLNNKFNIDTRDFHAGYLFEEKTHPDYSTLKKYPNFFFTLDELKKLLHRYYIQSGGENEWRFFSLINLGKDWSLTYLRIWRTELGFIICDSNEKAIKKELLDVEINKKLL